MAYTWSKAHGDFLDHLSAGGGAIGNAPGSTYAMEKDYGLLAFDIPHRLVTSFIYELPFGTGTHVRIRTASLGAIAGGWSVNGILTLSDGRPFTVTTTDQARHGPGPHRARQLRRRRGAGRIQPDAGFVDGSGGVRADDGRGRTATARTTRCADPDRSR